MDVLQFIALRRAERFEIVREEGGIAYFLFRYENGRNTHDHFQPDLAMCQRCGKDLYGIMESDWVTPSPFELAAWNSRQSEWESSAPQA